MAYEFITENPLSLQNIKKAHRLLSANLLPPSQQGAVRTNPMLVINSLERIEYVAANPAIVEDELEKLFADIDYLSKTAQIHPFQDGNGRLSRILTTLLLLQAGYAYVPYSSLESVIEQSKEGYYLALRQTQGTIRSDAPNWQPWLIFFLRALQQQMKRLAKKIDREKFVLSSLPALSLRILDHARDHGRVSMGDIIKLTGASRNTLKQQFRQLVDKGHLTMHGGGRTTWYTLP